MIPSEKQPRSHSSRHSLHSRGSHHSLHPSLRSLGTVKQLNEAVLKQSEQLASAKARLKYAEEEASLMKQEVELNASKMVLNMKRELDEAK